MRSFPSRLRRVLVVTAVALTAVACGDDDASTADTTTTPSDSSSTSSSSDPAPAEREALVFFLRGEKVGAAARTVDHHDALSAALVALFEGPTDSEAEIGLHSEIPAGTELRGVSEIEGVVTVDVSNAFTTGGGSSSMMARVAQVVHTATQFGAGGVRFAVDGEPLTVLGGEGLLLEEPQTVADYEDLSPAILLHEPAPFDRVTSPLRLTGTANTFEAVFQIVVVDGDGLIVHEDFAMATSGSGTRGTFDVTVEFDVPTPGLGAVIVFEYSAEDGSQINLVEVPVQIS